MNETPHVKFWGHKRRTQKKMCSLKHVLRNQKTSEKKLVKHSNRVRKGCRKAHPISKDIEIKVIAEIYEIVKNKNNGK